MNVGGLQAYEILMYSTCIFIGIKQETYYGNNVMLVKHCLITNTIY